MTTDIGTRALVGVDVGGSGREGGGSSTWSRGQATGRVRIEDPATGDTPNAIRAHPSPVSSTSSPVTGTIGCTLPAVVTNGEVRTATNIDKSWIGVHAGNGLVAGPADRPYVVLNDADGRPVSREARFGRRERRTSRAGRHGHHRHRNRHRA